MSVLNKVRNLLLGLFWKQDATWRNVVVIAAAIVLVIALIGAAR